MTRLVLAATLCSLLTVVPTWAQVTADTIYDAVEHHYVDNEGVNIHYVTHGEGPVLLFIHGFPNQWYDWRHQMAALSDAYQVVAISLRGYNRSDRPTGVAQYEVEHLTADVAAVIRDLGQERLSVTTGAASSGGRSPSAIPR